jgi:TP901 family phage tail tape measure protein
MAGVAGAGIVAGLGVAIKSAADFEKGLSGIQAVSGATTAEMETVRKKALQLGADTAFSASDASQAIEELVKAGISIPDVMNGAADATVALAAAGGVALPEAATIASNAMNQFGLSAEELPGIADKIAGAANASAIDVSDLGQSFQQAGAVAHLAGLSFDDTALAIAAMGNAGIKGSDAGTSLKSMLQRLQPTTKAQSTLMKNLGLITKDGANQFFDATGKIKGMADIAQILQDSLKGMSDQQKTATLQTLFGADAIRAAAVIADNGAKGINDMATAMGKMKAADVAATRMNNLSGQIEQMKGSAETFAIQTGSILIPVLTNVVKKLTDAVNWFTNLSDGQKKALTITLAAVGGFLLAVAAIVKTTMAVKEAVVAFKAIAAAAKANAALVAIAKGFKAAAVASKAFTLSLLTNPIFLIIAGIVALVAALVILYKKNETFRNFVNAAWASIKNAIMAVVGWLTGTAWPAIKAVWDGIVSGAQAMWSGVSTAWNAIVTAIKTVVSVIVTIITTYVNMWLTIITTALNAIKAVWNAVWGLFGPLIKAVFDLVIAIIQFAVLWALEFIKATLSAIAAVWSAIWNAIVAVAQAVWAVISAVITREVNGIKKIVTTVFNAVKAVVTSVWNAIKSLTTAVWNAIYNAISGPINKAKSIVSSVANTIKSAISTAFNAAKTATSTAFSALYSAVSTQMGKAYDKVKDIVGRIKGFFSGAGSWLKDAGRRLIQGLIDGIQEMIGKVTGAINKVTSIIKNHLPGSPVKEGPLVAWNDGSPGKKLVDMLAGGISDNIGAISAAFRDADLGVGSILASPEVALAGSAARTRSASIGSPRPGEGAYGAGPLIGQQNVYYPRAEPASQAATRSATRAALLGGPR